MHCITFLPNTCFTRNVQDVSNPKLEVEKNSVSRFRHFSMYSRRPMSSSWSTTSISRKTNNFSNFTQTFWVFLTFYLASRAHAHSTYTRIPDIMPQDKMPQHKMPRTKRPPDEMPRRKLTARQNATEK